MRWSAWMLLLACGCSMDWSVAGSGGSGGTTGVGASTSGGVGGETGGSGGWAADPSGGTAGVIPPGGGGSVACSADACLGQSCNAETACGGGTVHCCVTGQDCATPSTAGSTVGKCVPAGCADAADTVQCSGSCPKYLCDYFGLVCCPNGTCQKAC